MLETVQLYPMTVEHIAALTDTVATSASLHYDSNRQASNMSATVATPQAQRRSYSFSSHREITA